MKKTAKAIILVCLLPISNTIAGAPEVWSPIGFNEKAFTSVFESQNTQFNDIAYGDSRNDLPSLKHPYGEEHGWMAVGEDFVIFHYDGANAYTQRMIKSPDPYFPDLNTVRYNNGRWLITGELGAILTSLDTENWQQFRVGEMVNWIDQAYGASTWVVVGVNELTDKRQSSLEGWIAHSTDAIHWSTAQFPGFKIQSLARSPTQWTITGQKVERPSGPLPYMLVSDDAINWKSIELSSDLLKENSSMRHINHANGQWVGVIEERKTDDTVRSHIVVSKTLSQWDETLVLNGEISKPRFGQDEWIFLQKTSFDSPSPLVYQSEDGRDWNIIDAIESRFMKGQSITSAEGLRIAVGTPSATGTNHILAAPRYQLESSYTFEPPMLDVLKIENEWLAVGKGGAIHLSDNGRQWTTLGSGSDTDLISVCKGKDIWTAISRKGEIFSSLDRKEWTRLHQFEGVIPFQIESGQGQWVVIGYDVNDKFREQYSIFTSTNLLDWKQTEYKGLFGNHRVAYGNDTWIIQGPYQRLRSEDGYDWSIESSIAWTPNCYLAYGDGQFIGTYCHNYNLLDVGELFRSENGVEWQGIRNGGPLGFADGWWWCNTLYERWLHARWTEFMVSKDGLHWDKIGDPRTNFPGDGHVHDFIREQNAMHVFTKGTQLTYGSKIKDSVPVGGRPTNMAKGDDHWLAVDGNDLLLSPDGHAWAQTATLDHPVDLMAFGSNAWGLVQWVRASMDTENEWNMVFSTFEVGSAPRVRFQWNKQKAKPREIEYHFGRWWLLVGQDLYAINENFEPERVFEGADHLLRNEVPIHIEFSEDTAIAVTNMGTFIRSETSSDFRDWNIKTIFQRYMNIDQTLKSPNVTYQDLENGDGIWMGIHIYKNGSSRSVWIDRSVDGLSWKRIPFEPGQLVRNEFTARIAYANGCWGLITGGDKLSASSSIKLFVSADGNDWKLVHETSPASFGPDQILADENQWFALIPGGLLRSGPKFWLNLDRDKNTNQSQLNVNGLPANTRFSILQSEDLKQWQLWHTAKSGIGPLKINLPELREQKGIFFRALTPVE